MGISAEIHEQPAVLQRLLRDQMTNVRRIAQRLSEQDVRFVVLAARGTSDNAGLFAKYLWGINNRLPVAGAAPSMFSLYKRPPLMKGALVVGLSQSGESPDVVSVVVEGRRQGAPTLAITNRPASPLGQAAKEVIDLGAGEEQATPATKTYTAELMAVAMLSAALARDAVRLEELGRIPEGVVSALEAEPTIEQVATRYRFVERCAVISRGYNLATAHELCLKLKELTRIAAEPYSSADFMHGPIAMVRSGFPILLIAPRGEALGGLRTTAGELKARGAELLVISDDQDLLRAAPAVVPMPAGTPEWLSPIVAIVPGQLFAMHLTLLKGYDPDMPEGIRKVTLTE
jgi:glucosamine--fructose-6-phosphate aminotransferase (isomerizing)